MQTAFLSPQNNPGNINLLKKYLHFKKKYYLCMLYFCTAQVQNKQ